MTITIQFSYSPPDQTYIFRSIHGFSNGDDWHIRPFVSTVNRTYKLPRTTCHPSIRADFIRLGSVTANRKNGLTGEQLAVGTDSRSVGTGSSRILSVLMEGCHVGLFPRVRTYGSLYLRTVEYGQWVRTCTKFCSSDSVTALNLSSVKYRPNLWNLQTEMRFGLEQLLFQRLPSGNRSCFKRNLISVCTLTQSSGGTSCGLTNIKLNWIMSTSDWKCSTVHRYWLNQS